MLLLSMGAVEHKDGNNSKKKHIFLSTVIVAADQQFTL